MGYKIEKVVLDIQDGAPKKFADYGATFPPMYPVDVQAERVGKELKVLTTFKNIGNIRGEVYGAYFDQAAPSVEKYTGSAVFAPGETVVADKFRALLPWPENKPVEQVMGFFYFTPAPGEKLPRETFPIMTITIKKTFDWVPWALGATVVGVIWWRSKK